MTEQELNRKIKGAFTRATPDVLDAIRSQCDEQKGTMIYMMQPKKKKNRWAAIAAAAAALALVIGVGAGVGTYSSNRAVASTVSLDVNPSIEISVNKNETVLAVTPLNEDAQIVVGTMDFGGSSLEVTVNALIGSMLRNGYLNELANSILISVDDADVNRGKELEARLAGVVDSMLHTGTFDGSVLSQTITADSELEALAAQYGITTGKARLIQQIVAQNAQYTFEDLAPLSINELNLISESGSLHLDQVSSTGSASDKAYVGREGAKSAALAYIGVAESDVLHWECELDFDHGRLVYDVEFATATHEHDCNVSAITGEVITHHSSGHDDHHGDHHGGSSGSVDSTSGSASASGDSYITADAAKAAAQAHAGVDSAYGWECELDQDDGRMVYEIEFKSGLFEYSYEISAADGSVLRYERDWILD